MHTEGARSLDLGINGPMLCHSAMYKPEYETEKQFINFFACSNTASVKSIFGTLYAEERYTRGISIVFGENTD